MNRKIPPPIKDAIQYNLLLKPYELFTLDNGIPVYTVHAGAQEVLQIEFVFYAGNFFENKKGVASATNFLLRNGTSSRTALQINEGFEYYGAHCNRSCYSETAVVTLHTLSRHIDKLLPILNDIFTDSVLPDEEIEIYKQNTRQRLAVNMKKCEFVASRLIDSYLYGAGHPYGAYTNVEDIDVIQKDELKQFYNQYYKNGTCAIFVAGNIPADLSTQLNLHFGKLTVGKPDFGLPDRKTSPAVEKKTRIENDPNAVQGAIRLATNFPNRHHPDFKKVVVLNNLFGGFFGSRLMNNIREEKGYTYGIYSYLQNHIQQSGWMISTEAGKDVCEATIEEVYKEMKRLREEKIDESELLLVRNYMIGGILGDLDGPFHIMSKWKNILLNKLDENYFYESVDAIKNVTARELMELANKYLHPENFYELIVY
ncbi:MAG TPA: pitrilysin family protein [Ferruginibacter sp.]|nr:pitrilysin family protein [Ferruginibacter sp.]